MEPRTVRYIKEECLGMVILFGGSHLHRVLDEYVAHYHAERNHQGIGNELIEGPKPSGAGPVVCRKRFGGLLRYYYRAA